MVSLLGVSACTASSGGPSGGPSDAPSGAVGKGGGYTLTVENAGARCAYATVKVRTEGGGSAGGRPGVIYSKAFSGGKVSLSGTSYGADGTATPLLKASWRAAPTSPVLSATTRP